MEGDCYNKVGEDLLDNIEESEDEESEERYEVYRVRLQSNITVQPGDVVGYLIIRGQNKRLGYRDGVVLNQTRNTESVWHYGESTQRPPEVGPDSCQISTGPNGTLRSLTQAAPLLSVAIGKLKVQYEIFCSIVEPPKCGQFWDLDRSVS